MSTLAGRAIKALEIVEHALDWQRDTGECHFCEYERGKRAHQDCPLVEAGFIDRHGEALLRPSDEPKPTTDFIQCNHHHELTARHKIVDFGDGVFVANLDAIPLLKALNEIGLRTRTHHVVRDGDPRNSHAFVSILLGQDVTAEIRTVNERDATRTKFNGKPELLLTWRVAPSPYGPPG